MRSILFVTRHTPLPWEDGAGAYLHDLARFLAQSGFRVDVLWLAPHEDLRWQKIWRLPDAFDSSVRLRLPSAIRYGRHFLFPGMIWYPFKARALHRARQLLEKCGFSWARRTSPAAATLPPRPWMSPPSAAELAIVETFARELQPDVILASYAWMCPIFLLPALKDSRHACLTHDVAWKRAQLAAGPERPEVSREDEAAWLQSAGTLIAISESDALELRALVPSAQVLVAPKACEIPAANSPVPTRASRRLLFVGSGNAFNVEGLGWFLREVWPQIHRAAPDCALDVCGSIAGAVSLRPEGVVFHGNVPDLAPYYRDATVVIVPLLRATGLNIKLADAAASGRAIVATSATLAGAPFLRDGVIAADSPAEFAAAIQLLLTDTGANAAVAARALAAVRTHLSPATCYGPLAAHLRSAA